MWSISLLLCCAAALTASVSGGLHVRNNGLSEYTITPSSQLAYYHYPAPGSRTQNVAPQQQSQQRQQPHYQQQPQQQQQHAASVQHYAPQRTQTVPQQQQQQQQRRPYQYPSPAIQTHQQAPQQHSQQQQQQQYRQHNQQPSLPVAKQFASPALENAAFTMALTNQGYVFGASPSSALLTLPLSSASSDANSLNVKLPLPFNITPINIGPLPLQAGAPYDSIPHDVTSYGTKHPLRR